MACAKIQKHEDICVGCTVLRPVIQSVHVETGTCGDQGSKSLECHLKELDFYP